MRVRIKRPVAALMGMVGLGAAAALVAIGCSGDDTAVSKGDSGTDATLPDAAPDNIVTGSDAADSATDAGVDVGVDSAPPPIDAASFDAPPLGSFIQQVNAAYCHALQQCCLVSSSAWLEANCEADQAKYGTYAEINRYAASFDAGRVIYNPAAADQCFADFAQIPLSVPSICGLLTGTYYNKIKDDCFAAVVGTVPWDGGSAPNDAGPYCMYSNECLPGGFCAPSPDGGLGTCAPIQPLGAPCSTAPGIEPCSYLGLGVPANYCDPSSHDTCQPAQGIDAGCTADEQCQSETCTDTCVASAIFSDPGVPPPDGLCAYYTATDGGTDAGGD